MVINVYHAWICSCVFFIYTNDDMSGKTAFSFSINYPTYSIIHKQCVYYLCIRHTKCFKKPLTIQFLFLVFIIDFWLISLKLISVNSSSSKKNFDISATLFVAVVLVTTLILEQSTKFQPGKKFNQQLMCNETTEQHMGYIMFPT